MRRQSRCSGFRLTLIHTVCASEINTDCPRRFNSISLQSKSLSQHYFWKKEKMKKKTDHVIVTFFHKQLSFLLPPPPPILPPPPLSVCVVVLSEVMIMHRFVLLICGSVCAFSFVISGVSVRDRQGSNLIGRSLPCNSLVLIGSICSRER